MIEIVTEPIDFRRLLEFVTRPQCGAEVLFVGTTRQWTEGVETKALSYEAYAEMALAEMIKLSETAKHKWTVEAVAMVHRTGRVEIAEASVAIAVGAAHRGPAFAAAEWLIDELKVRVPIWKRELDADGQSHWVHPT